MLICFVILWSAIYLLIANGKQLNVNYEIAFNYFWGILYLTLLLVNLHIAINLLIAMKRHQHFEYVTHKKQIIIQLALTSLTLVVLASLNYYFATYYYCTKSEFHFNMTPEQDPSSFCSSLTGLTFLEIT